MQGTTDNLEQFAKRIETRIRAGLNGSDSMERLICRILTNKKSPTNAAVMASKWVDWRYGKAKETVKVEGTVTHEHVSITEQLTDSELEQVEKLIESAESRANQK